MEALSDEVLTSPRYHHKSKGCEIHGIKVSYKQFHRDYTLTHGKGRSNPNRMGERPLDGPVERVVFGGNACKEGFLFQEPFE
jgi:hypothetical protein